MPACTGTVRLFHVRTAATYFENFDRLLGNLTYVLSTGGFPKIVEKLGREKLGLSTYEV